MKTGLNKDVFDKITFQKVVDTSFKELVTPSISSSFDLNLATIEDFFTLYNKFFYQIPKKGAYNSHQYLIQTSNNYVNIDLTNSEIQDLLNEIKTLREENLKLQQEMTNLTISSSLIQ